MKNVLTAIESKKIVEIFLGQDTRLVDEAVLYFERRMGIKITIDTVEIEEGYLKDGCAELDTTDEVVIFYNTKPMPISRLGIFSHALKTCTLTLKLTLFKVEPRSTWFMEAMLWYTHHDGGRNGAELCFRVKGNSRTFWEESTIVS